MKLKTFLLAIVLLVISSNVASAGDWTFNIMGITPKHFEGRSWKIVVLGAVTSLAVHELGHLAWAHYHGGGHFDWDERAVIMDDYHNRSHGDQQMFHRAGFLAQLTVGSVLTAIPTTRHADFTVGFSSLAAFEVATYVLFDHGDEDISDVRQLDHGAAEVTFYTVAAGTLSYINIKKPIEKERENGRVQER